MGFDDLFRDAVETFTLREAALSSWPKSVSAVIAGRYGWVEKSGEKRRERVKHGTDTANKVSKI